MVKLLTLKTELSKINKAKKEIIVNQQGCKISNLALGIILANLCLVKPVAAENANLTTPSTTKSAQLDTNRIPGYAIAQNNFNRADGAETAEVLLEALKIANTIADPESKATVLSEIASKYGKIGEFETALELLSEALEIANTIDEDEVEARAKVLSAIAVYYAELDEFFLAEDILSQALEQASLMGKSEQKASLLAAIALKYADIGEYQISSQILSEGQDVVTALTVYFPLDPTSWQGSVTLGLYVSSDQNTTSLATIIARLERTWPRHEFSSYLAFTNDFDSSREGDDENRLSGQLAANYRYHFSARWQYFFNSFVARDDANDVDFRSSFATGIGLNLWRGGAGRSLDMQLGFGVGFESSIRDTNEVDFPLIQYRLLYEDIFLGSLEFSESFTFELPLNNTSDYYMQSVTTIAVPLSKQWALDNSLIFEYFAIPIGDNPNLEMQLRTGLRYSF